MSIHGKQIADTSIAGSKLQNATVTQEKLSLTSPVASTDAATKQYVDDGLVGSAYDQQVYVAAGADPLVATGSVLKPFTTVTAAMASITDATPTKRYAIMVSAGSYAEPGAVNLKANVFIVGATKNSVRITASSWALDANFTGGSDNRSGMSNVILAGAGTYGFNWTTVTSTAGKLYFDSVSFSAALTLTGYNNAIAQAQFSNCQMFGAFAVQGVNVGIFNDNILFSNLTLTQSPYGGVPTILNAVGGYCSGTVTATTTVTDFNRRISIFARSFWMNAVTVDGASVYLDYTVDSLPSAGATVLNGANLVSIDLGTGANKSLSNLNFPTAVNNPIMPASSSATNLGDWGKQWMFNFNYVNVSTGTDIYIGTVDSAYDGAGSASGYSVYLQPDQYGVRSDVNGGFLDMRTANATGTGISGKVEIATGTSVNGNSGDINLTTGTTSGTGTRGIVNIESRILDLKLVDELKLNGAAGTSGQVLTSQGAGNAPIWSNASTGITGTIAANEIAFGSGVNSIGGDSRLTWDGGSGAMAINAGTLAITGTGHALSVVDIVDGEVFHVNPSLYEVTNTDPTDPSNRFTSMQPGQLTAYDTGNSAQLNGYNADITLQASVAGALVPTIVAKNDAAVAAPLNLSISALQINSASGTLGQVLTSQGAGSAPVWDDLSFTSYTAGNGLDLIGGSEFVVLANGNSISVAATGVQSATLSPTTLDQNPLFATANDNAPTGIVLGTNPRGSGVLHVLVNGLRASVGLTKECYFSNDGGVTAVAYADLATGDALYWNGIVAGYDLDTTDEITFVYQDIL